MSNLYHNRKFNFHQTIYVQYFWHVRYLLQIEKNVLKYVLFYEERLFFRVVVKLKRFLNELRCTHKEFSLYLHMWIKRHSMAYPILITIKQSICLRNKAFNCPKIKTFLIQKTINLIKEQRQNVKAYLKLTVPTFYIIF